MAQLGLKHNSPYLIWPFYLYPGWLLFCNIFLSIELLPRRHKFKALWFNHINKSQICYELGAIYLPRELFKSPLWFYREFEHQVGSIITNTKIVLLFCTTSTWIWFWKQSKLYFCRALDHKFRFVTKTYGVHLVLKWNSQKLLLLVIIRILLVIISPCLQRLRT